MKPSASTEISRHAQWREQILSGARHTAICSRGQLQVPSGMTNTPPGCGRAWRGAWGEREGASAARCPPPTAHRPSPVARRPWGVPGQPYSPPQPLSWNSSFLQAIRQVDVKLFGCQISLQIPPCSGISPKQALNSASQTRQTISLSVHVFVSSSLSFPNL